MGAVYTILAFALLGWCVAVWFVTRRVGAFVADMLCGFGAYAVFRRVFGLQFDPYHALIIAVHHGVRRRSHFPIHIDDLRSAKELTNEVQ